MRSDAQLVALFRAGHDEAFRIIHDRYRQRLFAYTRQMLCHRQDAEDALQDVFVRAYSGLRASDRDLALRAWLYRVAHNRCIDELRRPDPPSPELLELVRPPEQDPIAEADKREALRRLIADVRRLPEQQRSALLMRELGGMSYTELAEALDVSVAAVKSLLVRARMALAQALEARDTACSEIQEQLSIARDRGVRPSAAARLHMRDCDGCRRFHKELRCVGRQFAAITPAAGPLGILAKVLGLGGLGGGASSYAAAGGGAAAAGGAGGAGAAVAGLFGSGAGHVATLLAAAIVTAGGAVEIQHTIAGGPARHPEHHRALVRLAAPRVASGGPSSGAGASSRGASSVTHPATSAARATVHRSAAPAARKHAPAAKPLTRHHGSAGVGTHRHTPGSESQAAGVRSKTNSALPSQSAPAGNTGTASATTTGSDPGVCAGSGTGAAVTGGAGGATVPGSAGAAAAGTGATGASAAGTGTAGSGSTGSASAGSAAAGVVAARAQSLDGGAGGPGGMAEAVAGTSTDAGGATASGSCTGSGSGTGTESTGTAAPPSGSMTPSGSDSGAPATQTVGSSSPGSQATPPGSASASAGG